ncbi:Kinesin-like protein kif24 [Dinochytrium kinnereticum]|nr:Kinesin-like protein kif24 [Dinochytrium kinnereticum]
MQDYGIVGVSSMEDRKTSNSFSEADLSNPNLAVSSFMKEKEDPFRSSGLSFLPKPSFKPSNSITQFSMVMESSQQAPISGRAATEAVVPTPPLLNENFSSRRNDFDYDTDDSEPLETVKQPQRKMFPNASPKKKGSGPLLNAYGIPTSTTSLNNSKSNLSKATGDLNDRIRVCVRKRPLNKKELRSNQPDIAPITGKRGLTINEPKVKVDLTKFVEQHEFTFDEVFDCDSTNDEVYRRTAWPLVEYIFTGGKATCFAYGQTGSGKTFTMLDEKDGLYVKAGRDIFAMLKAPEYQNFYAVVSFYEIYQSHLYDLLNSRKRLYAREDGKQQVCIVGLQEHEVSDVEELMKIFEFGNNARSTGKLSFIDLAGSERGADRGDADKQTRMEGSEINKSLLALKECIRALDQDSKHTPFRQSKLTQVLKDSFIGVKELKGSGVDDYEDKDASDPSYLTRSEDLTEDHLPLDLEFPPENLAVSDNDLSDDDSEIEDLSSDSDDPSNDTKALSLSNVSPNYSQTRPSEDSLYNGQEIDQLVQLHRQHMKLFTDLGRTENRLVAGLGTGRKVMSKDAVTADVYVRELDEIMSQKLESISRIQSQISKLKKEQ